MFFYNGKNYRTNVVNGNFSIQIIACTAGIATAYVTAYDITTNKVSDTLSLAVTAGNNATTGKLTACGVNVASTINLTIGTTRNYAYTTPIDSFICTRTNNANTSISVTSSDRREQFSIGFNGNAAPGDYALNALKFNYKDTVYYMSGASTVRITQYGNLNEFISGSFSGNVEKSDSSKHPMSFTFKVKRQRLFLSNEKKSGNASFFLHSTL